MDPFDSILFDSEYLLRHAAEVRAGAIARDPDMVRASIDRLDVWIYGVKRTLEKKIDAEAQLRTGEVPA